MSESKGKGNRTHGEGRRGGKLKRWSGSTHPTGMVKQPLRRGEAAKLITPAIIEKLASTWLPIRAIAAKIGVGENTLEVAIRTKPVLCTAYANGIAARSTRVSDGIEGLIGSNALVTLVAAQQSPEIGGLGWIRPGAPAQRHEHSGAIRIEIVKRVLGPGEALAAPISVDSQRIGLGEEED